MSSAKFSFILISISVFPNVSAGFGKSLNNFLHLHNDILDVCICRSHSLFPPDEIKRRVGAVLYERWSVGPLSPLGSHYARLHPANVNTGHWIMLLHRTGEVLHFNIVLVGSLALARILRVAH